MDQLVGLRVFCAVVEFGSFVKAAERLEMSTPMVSKHVLQLEQRLGVRLLHRTSRRLSLTEVGRAYFETVRGLLDDLDEAEHSVSREAEQPSGRLRVTAPNWFSNDLFGRLLGEFYQAYPNVVVDLDLSDRMLDIVEEGYDLALRVSRDLQTSLLTRRLCPIHFRLVAAPALGTTRLRHLESLEGFPWLEYVYANDGPRLHHEDRSVLLKTALRTNSTSLIHQAARAGLGLALLPEWLIANDLKDGSLAEVLPHIRWPSPWLYAVCSSRRYLSARVQVFLKHVEQALNSDSVARPG